MEVALYPGSFDPITNGHLDIIERASKIFDRLIVAILVNAQKQTLFTVEERMDMIREVTRPHVEVDHFEGLLVDYARRRGVHTVVRGLRAVTDFEYEFQMALTNRQLNPEFESVFLMTSKEYAYLSATIVREVAQFGGAVDPFVPPYVARRLREKFQNRRKT
ncbi:MAG: pantetheine-phosphate adenylyltransferase [Candidatus Latescibacteria bacterium]|nr:pantetheine-phosphate adenylyltransferase [Candidatus Latescibacterota bacterium]